MNLSAPYQLTGLLQQTFSIDPEHIIHYGTVYGASAPQYPVSTLYFSMTTLQVL